jgi:hypothetical protein
MNARVSLLRTGFEQIIELFVAPDQFLNRKHDSSVVIDCADGCNPELWFVLRAPEKSTMTEDTSPSACARACINISVSEV